MNIRDKGMQDVGCGMRGFFPCPLHPASCILFVIALVSCCGVVVGAEPLLVSVSGAPVEAKLVGFGADGRVSFVGKAPFSIHLDELVRWGHSALPRPQTWVLLADGSRLVTAADWSGGVAVQLDGENVVVQSVAWDDAQCPRALVTGIVFSRQERPEDRQQLEDRLRAETVEKDTVFLTNQDRLSGRLVKLAGGSLEMDVDGRETSLPLSRVAAVVLGKSRPSSVASRPMKLILGMRDGSLLHAAKVAGAEDNLAVELAGGAKLTGGNVDDVVALQGSGGGKFVYLSDLEPADYKHVPYLSIAWPYRRDRNVLGGPLMVGGERYLKGIGMHSAARLTYRLDGKYQRFDAMAALDDSSQGRGSVTFGVYVLRGGEWKPAAVSDTVHGGAGPEPVSVDVRGAEMITLTVDYADRGDELDHADWLDARLLKD
jgi:NPCBM/NEW2 domain-containing protein